MAERRLFRILLLLYPAAFRREYGGDMVAAMQRRQTELYRAGPRRLRLAAALTRDLAFALPRAWWTHGLRRRRTFPSPLERTPLMSNMMSDQYQILSPAFKILIPEFAPQH